jgi:hypothetical protein
LNFIFFFINIIPDINKIIAEYAAEYQLLPWINLDKINWYILSGNSTAIHILEKNLDKINWDELSGNKSIFKLNTQDIISYMCNNIY